MGTATWANPRDCLGQTVCQRHPASPYADKGEVLCSACPFDDLVRESLKRPANFFGREELSFFDDAHRGRHRNTDRDGFAAAESRGGGGGGLERRSLGCSGDGAFAGDALQKRR